MPVHSYKTKKGTKYRYIFGYQGKSYEKWGFSTSKEAKQAEAEQRQKLQEHGTENILFNDLVAEYLADIEKRIAKSTLHIKQTIISKHIIGKIPNKPISEITALTIRNWQNEIIGMNFKPTFQKTVQSQLSAIFNYGVKFYNLPKNPVPLAGSLGKNKRDKVDFWTYDEFIKVLGVIDDEHVYIEIYTLFYTGMRIGECLALTWNDLDSDNNILRVSKSLTFTNGEWYVSKPKTDKSIRNIIIPQKLTTMLLNYKSKTMTDTIFTISKANLKHKINKYSELAGVHRIRVHDLRHSHASLLINLGVDIVEVAQRLGHETVQTTINTYIHLYPDRQQKIADKLESLGNS